MNQFRYHALILAGSIALAAAVARAVEIPLEGFGKSTKVAYVNMHKIFEAFPETEKARVELNQLIDEKKSEITAKKEEIARLKGEIDFLRKQMTAVQPGAQKTDSKTTKPQEPPVEVEPVQTSTAEPQAATSLTLPENSPMKFLFSPPAESTAPASTDEGASLSTSAARPVLVSTNAPAILPGVPSPAPQLSDKEAALVRLQSELQTFVGSAEEEVRQLEEGKTMTLLARIYKALADIAVKDNYSVIVDKDNILFGDNAVDVTQDVIWRLSNPRLKKGPVPQ